MSVFVVHVAVALRRPPRVDEVRRYAVEAADALSAELVACQWAFSSPGVAMAVGSNVVDVSP